MAAQLNSHLMNKLFYFHSIFVIIYYFIPRNVILVVGDGMSLTTATAARILRGQRMGQSGEDTDLVWDTFPAVALAKVLLIINMFFCSGFRLFFYRIYHDK